MSILNASDDAAFAKCVSVCLSAPVCLHLSPPSSLLQAENCIGSNCLTFYGSEIVSLSLMDNDGASPCYANLCDNETTDQPCCSTSGSREKADNPEGASRCCLTTRPRAPCSVTLLLYVHMGDGGVTEMCCFCLCFHVAGFDLRLLLLWIINPPIEDNESLDS